MRVPSIIVQFSIILSLASFMSCDEETAQPVIVDFEESSITALEGDEASIEILFSRALPYDACIMIELSNTTAALGVDYQLNQLVQESQMLSVWAAKGAQRTSINFLAMEDYEVEETETVSLTIIDNELMKAGETATLTLEIQHAENYPTTNRALAFDGIDDYVDLGNIYDDLTLPVTMSAWIWLDPNAPGGSIPIFDSQDGLPVYNGVNFLTSNTSSLGVQYGDGQGENNSAFRRAKSVVFGPIAERWVNFTVVMRSATDMSLYYNGIDVGGDYSGGSNLPLHSNSPTETAKIGSLIQNGINYKFKGYIDEFKIWNRSLDQTEVQKVIFTKQDSSYPGLIGYWDFDEATGNSVMDKSIKGFNGTLMGGVNRIASTAPVK